MTYQIISQSQIGSSLNVTVNYTLDDGSSQNGVTVAMYGPQSQQDIINNIISRGQSIQNEANATLALSNLLSTINLVGITGTI